MLVVPHYQVVLAVDALPVYEEHFALMNDTVRLVEFVEHHWFQQLSLRKEVLHFEIALLMQLVRCNPDERHLPEWQVATALQFLGECGEHFACHHRLSSTRRSLQYHLSPVAIKSQQIDGIFHQLPYGLLLIF